MEAVFRLVENAVDEEGAPRELNEEEIATVQEWFNCTKDEFKDKADSYCKLIKNFKIKAENIDNERKTYKAELDRLASRSKVASNTADRLQKMIRTAAYHLPLHQNPCAFRFFLPIQESQAAAQANR